MENKDIEEAFIMVTGILNIMIQLDTYKDYKKDYERILVKINSWIQKYYLTEKIELITREELLEVYNAITNLERVVLFDKQMHWESQLSNKLSIWYWEFMELRKKEIENE